MTVSEFTKRATESSAGQAKPISAFTKNATAVPRVPILSTVKTNRAVNFDRMQLHTPDSGIVAKRKTNAPVDFGKADIAPVPEPEVPKSDFWKAIDTTVGKVVTGGLLHSTASLSLSEKIGEFTRKAAKAVGQGFARSTAAAGAAITSIPERIRALATDTAEKPGTGEFQPEGKAQEAVYGTNKPISLKTTGAEFGVSPEGKFAVPLGVAGSLMDLSGTGATGKTIRGLAGFKDAISAIRATKTEGEALSLLVKIGVPEDLAKFRALDVVKSNTDEAAEKLLDAIRKDMRTTKPAQETLPGVGKAITRTDAVGNTIKRNALNEVMEVINKDGKVIYRADEIPVKPKVPPVEGAITGPKVPLLVKRVDVVSRADELTEQLSNLKRAGLSETPVYREIQYQLSRLGRAAGKDEVAKTLVATEKNAARAMGVDRRIRTPGVKVPAQVVPKGMEALATEAQKYSSAEEFVKAQTPVFRGGDSAIDTTRGAKQGISVTTDRGVAENFTAPKNGVVGDAYLSPSVKILREVDIPKELQTAYMAEAEKLANPNNFSTQLQKLVLEKQQAIIEYARKNGFDAVDFPFEKEIRIIKPDVLKTKSQLTDFYNKVKGGVAPKIRNGTKDIPQMERMLERARKSLAEAQANPEAHAKAYGGDMVPKYQAKITELEERIAAARVEKKALGYTEEDSLEELASQHVNSEFVLRRSMREEEIVTSNLEMLFAEMKGVELGELNRFTATDLENAKSYYEIITEALIDHPGRFFAQFRLPGQSWQDFQLDEALVRGMKTRGKGKNIDIYLSEHGFSDIEEAQNAVKAYLNLRKEAAEAFADMRDIAKNIRLSKQRDAFVGAEKARLSKAAARNLDGLRAIAEAAEKAGYRKGFTEGNKRFTEMVARLKNRRTQINAIKRAFNLTDTQMKKIRGPKDPRFMDAQEFGKYLDEVRGRAELERARDQEKLFIEDMIAAKDLQKTENLQRALEFPPVKDMTLEQLVEYGEILSKTRPDDTFLGPRMIQTAKNTDLGNIRTIGEGRDAIAKQTGMPFEKTVEGAKMDKWLRDPTLVERDPLHKMFITEWTAKEADMLTQKYALNKELTKLADAARSARRQRGAARTLRQKVFSFLTPEDDLVAKWLQPFETTYVEVEKNGKKVLKKNVIVQPEIRAQAQSAMTPEEVKYAQFLEKFFSHYYGIAANEATARWTLQGVKHSNYRSNRIESVYLPHVKRGFFERWRDDGFVKAFKMLWERNLAETRVDFNAFGDRGEVLGYEKWLKNNMERMGEGIDKETGKVLYSQNTAKIALAYFHGFERKLIIDSMTPKIKMLEFLMGKRFETPKSITNPAGTEKVHSQLTRHINEWINNKKGQRVEIVYEQGDRAEAIVDASRLFIAVQQLGINIIAQMVQVAGGEVATFAGAGVKGWGLGHMRALTKQGREIGRLYSGIIGDTPWNELASAANDAGDTLRGGIFYLFGDVAYRGRRQMLLGLMSKEEFAAGKLAPERTAAIKLQMGKWLQMPEFRSIAGSTSFVKAAGMYTEWATPIIQNTYFVLIPRLRNMIRSTSPDKWKELAKSEEFQALFRATVGGASLGGMAYLVLNPDENDHSMLGYLRKRAAQEISSTIQAITFWGIPTPFSIMNGYIDSLRTAVGLLASMERYKTAGPGHKAGDLKAPTALGRALIPRGIQQWMPEPETPLKTLEDIKNEILQGIQSGELSMGAAKVQLEKELESLAEQEKKRRFTLSKEDYRADLKKRLLAKEITLEDAKKETEEYVNEQKKYAPESFESSSDADFIGKIQIAAKGLGTDPVTVFEAIFTGEEIRRMDNGEIILYRGKTALPTGQKEFSLKERRERGATSSLILDHTVPLQLGGDNADSNLKLVPKAEWERYTPVENFLGVSLRNSDINGARAQELIRAFKKGEIDEKGVYDAVERATR